jgi:hypothetical protein
MFESQTRVVFHPAMRCFWDTVARKRLKGMAKLLGKSFWPTYSFRRAARTPAAPGTHGVSARQGRARGTRVDREISRIVGGERVCAPHQLTTFALSALQRAGVRPVAAQVVVYSEGVATAVDILGECRDGVYAVVELKCSSDARYESPCGPMRAPLDARCDSLAQQHAVQALATRLLFEKTYSVRARAFLLRVNEGGATLTPLAYAQDVARAMDRIVGA